MGRQNHFMDNDVRKMGPIAKTQNRFVQAFFAALFLVFIVIIWNLFAPERVGGSANYIILGGSSMQPDFRKGDLVITRLQNHYTIGDLVAYFNTEGGFNIFHRIIGLEHDRFVLKGDSNSWVDSYQPTSEELWGRLWIHLPQMGKIVEWLRLPVVFALLSGSLVIILYKGVTMDKQEKTAIEKKIFDWTKVLEISFYTLGFLTFASLVLGLISFSKPIWRDVINTIEYQHFGNFSYSANVPAGVYDSTTLQEGEPIFTNLTCNMDIFFGYSLVGEQMQDVHGTYYIQAEVIDEQSGWKRTIRLSPQNEFVGNSFIYSTPLDICMVKEMVRNLYEQTDYRSVSHTMKIKPFVQISGKMQGYEFSDTYIPELIFKFDDVHFSLYRADLEEDPLDKIKNNQIQFHKSEQNLLSILGVTLPVVSFRVLSAILFILCFSIMAIMLFYYFSISRHDPEALIRLRYGPKLVRAKNINNLSLSNVVDVDSIDELAKLAELKNQHILYQRNGGMVTYLVKLDEVNYRYELLIESNPQAVSGLGLGNVFTRIRDFFGKTQAGSSTKETPYDGRS